MQVSSFSPLYRHTIGFDRFTDLFESALQNQKQGDAYPPYNIEKHGENDYRITMAVAGFKPHEIKVGSQDDEITITGTTDDSPSNVEYLYKGIATRNFQRKFSLSDYIKVAGARLSDGMLVIDLIREIPEARKPRNIEINYGGDLGQATVQTSQAPLAARIDQTT